MNPKAPFLFVALAAALFASCKKSPVNKPTSTNTSGVDVYAAGYIDPLSGFAVAVYWKNGVPVKLTDSTVTAANASGIAIAGSDVYVSGTINAGSDNPVAEYWKNGTATQLLAVQSTVSIQNNDPLESTATGIAAQGNNVYVVGWSTPTVASIWINGVLTKLASDSFHSEANAITLQGSDVYVAGYVNARGFSVATYWKNGSPTAVLSNTPNQISVANAIAVSGSDVYLAGYTYNGYGETVATYWKNGVATYLEPATLANTNSAANGIYVQGSDIYVVGDNGDAAAFWTNGVSTAIGGENANAITLQGNNVYIAGRDFNASADGATIWENNVPQIIGPSISFANAVTIVAK
ncbi:MAG TPA: hypothetical protein VFE53_08525 [Mucilaginibacter sp.]|jgi:hypothetical protein|nr:hypothetical protein [Mucilaginibacter sp.]